ncbi:response regulator [Propionibacterium australiense]|uniref:CheY-like superfamily n=1 Tax=Propionibacterium australiense TaxID=119981 RepID=A0A383S4W0_9ACTN|nr:response regulator transcription factor [Propionibacterium australiense]RLP11136.1 response regulator [Propionibacterium australiense]RLP12463.1 response regulator [Propionibacterium australiense]SYZ32721.1 CheY-like superfamily [Propionibacterium australiense]VEH91476.1 Response regulator protein vraR [Propionibacterium australiense]
MIRVLLADDQKLVRTGFDMILSLEDDIEVVAQACDGAQAVELARAERPDVILMDVQMPGVDGIEATRTVIGEQLAKVIMVTTFDRDDYVFEALGAGASGFVLKNADPDELVSAVRAVARGDALLSPQVTLRVIRAMAAPDANTQPPADHPEPAAPLLPAAAQAGAAAYTPELTDRETDVLRTIARGLSNAEIAAELFVSEATVKTHVSNLLSKLGLRDRVQAVAWAFRHGLAE